MNDLVNYVRELQPIQRQLSNLIEAAGNDCTLDDETREDVRWILAKVKSEAMEAVIALLDISSKRYTL